ncbi:DUF2076 domain-containing protein [Granulicella sibirica]|uniref:Putative transmembrane protein n=1 Tax=Granulicella sibirica TaxID=2479048 RepID=A0A4V1L5N8_9BACT|nr:DUF2076 domain-containing protein [Granulicella sibirica]RXH56414.1 putative transmembrane protein [Granulicella sibirica]
MTAQEQQLLQGLTDRISKTPLDEKDPEAEQYLQQTLGRNPDALYILAQTVLVQQYALDNAQKQLADLKTQLEDTRTQLDEAQQQAQRAVQQQVPQPKHTSFLGNLLGMKDDDALPPPPQTQYAPVQQGPRPGSFASNQQQYSAPPPPPYAQPQYAPQYGAPQYAPPQYGAPQYGAPQYAPPSQGGSFLRSAATTAAGVAAGAIAFEGIESLVHGFEHNGGQSMGSFGGNPSPREEIINNYYGDSSPSEHHSDHLSPDIEDRRNDTRQFADSGASNNTPVQDDDNNDFSDNTPAQDDDNNDFADTSSNDDYSGNDDDNNDFNS